MKCDICGEDRSYYTPDDIRYAYPFGVCSTCSNTYGINNIINEYTTRIECLKIEMYNTIKDMKSKLIIKRLL